MIRKVAVSVFATAAITTSAVADPGHGAGAGIVHFLTEPDHLAIMVAALVLGGWLFRRARQNG